MFSSTFTPPPTSVMVAVPLTPESRLGVSWRFMVSASCAATLPAKVSNANNAVPRADPASRAAWYTVFPLQYLIRAAAVLTWEAVVSVEPRIKLLASFYLNISWI
jgi:hypothetical protein